LKRYKLSEPAEDDLDGIFAYLADRSKSTEAVDRLEASFQDFFELLAKWPGVGRRYHGKVEGLRCYPMGSYIIAYVEGSDGIEILHVMPGVRDISRILGDQLDEEEPSLR